MQARRAGLGGRWLLVGVLLVGAAVLTGLALSGTTRVAAEELATVAVTRGNLIATVLGSGNVAAEQTLNLVFQTSGTVTDVLVKEGDLVQTGQVLARLDSRNAQLQVISAGSALASAQARLAQAQNGNARNEDILAAQAALTSARAAYDGALAAAETTDSQLRAAEAAMHKAQAARQQAQAAYDKVASAPNIAMLPQSLQLQQATIDEQQATANYRSLLQTAAKDAQARVDSAAAQLAQAQANLAKLTTPATASDLTIQQAAVSQAEAALKQAELALDNTALTAPFAGIVTQVNMVPGSLATTATPLLKLINRQPLHVDLKLTENDVAKVQLGQPVTVTIQSLGGWTTNGQVTFVAPAAENVNGVVTYIVRVSFADSDPRVRVGMTADLSIEVAHRENVLLVPNTALLPKGTQRVVQVPANGAATATAAAKQITREIEVVTGLSDGTNTEILSGLSEGQEIIALPDSGVRSKAGTGSIFGGF